MALGYLQTYPSRSYTLDRLGENFANYLRETRPDLDAAENPPTETDWPDFLIDLAMLERAIEVVFDGEGTEETPPLTAEQVAMIAPETFAASRLVLAPCVKLLRFRYPVNAYYTQARRAEPEQEVPLPEPRPEWVALGRRDFVVRRYPLNEPQWMLLSALQEGRTVGEAIEAAAPSVPEMDDARFGALLREWFGQWTADGFFMSVQPG